jgi:hypothetical protein
MVVVVSAGPSWTDITTAVGTVMIAAGAIGIAVVQYWRERTHTRRHEQFTAAYSVQIIQGERPAAGQSGPNPSVPVLVAVVDNRGPYTITGVEVQFCLDGRTLRPAASWLPANRARDVVRVARSDSSQSLRNWSSSASSMASDRSKGVAGIYVASCLPISRGAGPAAGPGTGRRCRRGWHARRGVAGFPG